MVLQIVFLCRAGNLLQNGGITSGIDMLLVGLDFACECKRFFETKFMDTNQLVCLRTSLAACFAFGVNLDVLVQLRFPGCACVFTTTTNARTLWEPKMNALFFGKQKFDLWSN